ncbi:MAG TPA: hypothetical protein VLN58_01450 [Verrucomicrobiae bacterium]|nr:hypothetical protein [Verrucomicrobiae bacterium]
MMKPQNSRLSRRLRLAGGLIMVGLAVQAVSLFWNHPLSFIVFVSVGALLLAAGIVIYLLTIVGLPQQNEDEVYKMNQVP